MKCKRKDHNTSGFVDFEMDQRERSDLGRRVQIKNIYLVFSNT